ncbi:hypothetical protein [Sulfurivermis fontis]|uniref:hypothetical protein n=1 Tax=Sulfurivermis fontis TaxID=1972068 RepID=UPI000FDCA31C|nr:hypothetical protein [Sulfurivermis fontis]
MSRLLRLLDATPPHWGENVIARWDNDLFKRLEPFATSYLWTNSGSLNVFRVIGTDHPDYQGQTWGWLLRNGKRMMLNLPLHESNRGYYLSDDKKEPTMSFITTDGHDWYVHCDGNHRTCIAKFDFHYNGLSEMRGLSLHDWRFDHDLFGAMSRLHELVTDRRLPVRLEVTRATVSREDNPGWMREVYRPAIDIHREGGVYRVDAAAARRVIGWLEGPWFARLFRAWPVGHMQEK